MKKKLLDLVKQIRKLITMKTYTFEQLKQQPNGSVFTVVGDSVQMYKFIVQNGQVLFIEGNLPDKPSYMEPAHEDSWRSKAFRKIPYVARVSFEAAQTSITVDGITYLVAQNGAVALHQGFYKPDVLQAIADEAREAVASYK